MHTIADLIATLYTYIGPAVHTMSEFVLRLIARLWGL